MATKQEIEAGTAINMGGTVPPGHALHEVRQRLLQEPRGRQWIIGQVVSASTKVEHPAEAEDRRSPTIVWADMVGITDTADCDQLAAMATRARNAQPGQGALEGAG